MWIVELKSCHYSFCCAVADFDDITMSLTFQASSPIGTVECATFSITDDNIMEPVESFNVTGSGGNFMGPSETQVNIQDNDGNKL